MSELRKLIEADNELAANAAGNALIVYLVNHAEDIAALIEAAEQVKAWHDQRDTGKPFLGAVFTELKAALLPFEANP